MSRYQPHCKTKLYYLRIIQSCPPTAIFTKLHWQYCSWRTNKPVISQVTLF